MEKMRKEEKGGKKLLLIKLFMALGLVVLTYVGYSVSKIIYKKNQVQKEIDALEEEARKIEKNNLELKEKIAYFESRDFQEKEVRDKLSLQNPSENLVVVKPGITKQSEAEKVIVSERSNVVDETPIFKKWWDYFFKY